MYSNLVRVSKIASTLKQVQSIALSTSLAIRLIMNFTESQVEPNDITIETSSKIYL